MHKPLSLFPRPRADHSVNSSISSVTKGADSLAFSLSDKNRSQESFIAGVGQHSVSKQLESLQMKLSDLETQIMPITLESCKEQTIKYGNKFDHNSTAEFFKRKKILSEGKENTMQRANAGKIVSRSKDKQRMGKTVRKELQAKKDLSTVQTQANNNTRNSIATEGSQLLQKSKEVSRLKKEVEAVRSSLQKTQRSMSQCSERLSASKSIIKRMKLQERRQERDAQRLRSQLKKSQGIREKQKQVILTQRRQLERCRELLKRLHRA